MSLFRCLKERLHQLGIWLSDIWNLVWVQQRQIRTPSASSHMLWHWPAVHTPTLHFSSLTCSPPAKVQRRHFSCYLYRYCTKLRHRAFINNSLLDGPPVLMARPMAQLLYLYRPTRIHSFHCSINHRRRWSLQLQSLKYVFKKYIFFQMMTPIDIRPRPCVTESPRGSACKISLPYYRCEASRRFGADRRHAYGDSQ